MRKPIVLIPLENPPENYVYSLKLVGLDYDCTFAPNRLQKYSGLLLTGGGDLLSSFYNCNVDCKNVNVLRDVNELKLLDYFFTNHFPILGVCRGMQVINTYLGGSLKTVTSHQTDSGDIVYHKVKSSSKIFNELSLVNSNHRQCVDKLCPFAQDVLTSSDGTIEGFSFENVLAVQFHPEKMDAKTISLIYGKFASFF